MLNRRVLIENLRSDGVRRNRLASKQRDSVQNFLFDDYMENDILERNVKRNPRIHSSRYAQDSMEDDDFLTDIEEEEYGRNRRRRSHPESRAARVQYKYIRVPVYPQERRGRRSRSLAYDDFSRASRPRTELRQTIRRSNSFKQTSRPSFIADRPARNAGYRNKGNGFAGNTYRSNRGGGFAVREGRWRHDKFKGEIQKRRMTPEELDKELEAYMKISKHPRVENF